MNHTKNTLEYLTFSLLAAVFLPTIIALTHPQPTPPPTCVSITVVFTACCLLGIILTLKPSLIRQHQTRNLSTSERPSSRRIHGHHPDCPVFTPHVIQTRTRTWCAGCLGLMLGLICATALFDSILVLGLTLPDPMVWLLLAFALIIIVYVESLRQHRRPMLHLLANSLLAPGFALIVIVTLQTTGQLIDGLFAILLCFLWMDTRIQLASWHHYKLCTKCSDTCKSYSDRFLPAGEYANP